MLERLGRLLLPPILSNEEKTRSAYFLTIFSWVSIVVILLTITLRHNSWTASNNPTAFILIGFVLFLLILQYILRLGHVKAASMLAVFSMWGVMTSIAVYSNGVRDLTMIIYFVILLLASILLGWRYVFLISLMSISAIWYLAWMEQRGLRPTRHYEPLMVAVGLTVVLVLTGALTYLLITNWARTLQSAQTELHERLRAEAKLQRQANFLTALHETSLGLLNQSELLPLLDSILTRACHLVETQHGLIELVLPDGSALIQKLGRGVLASFDGSLTTKGSGMTGQIWEKCLPLVIQDYPKWDKAVPEIVEMGVKSMMGVPLNLGDEVIGVLAVSYVDQDRRFTIEQTNLMERLADLASLAIHNTRLYEQLQNELNGKIAIESALRASEERFRKVFQASPVAICITTLEEGRLLEANDAFWAISGFDPSMSIGRTAQELNMVESNDKRRELVGRLKRERSIYLPDDNFLTPQAEPRIAQTFYELVEIKGQPCILTMLYDITQQKQDQLALKAAEARTRALLAAVPDMIFEVSRSGLITDFIPSTEISPMMPPENFLGKNIRDLFPPDITNQTMFAIERAIETNQLHAFEYGLEPGPDLQFFEARVSAISQDTAMIMVREISQRRWIESEREKLIAELEDKNAELERFTYTVSHDLKSPLITIRGFLGFVEQDAAKGNSARLKLDLKRISDAVEKMQILLNELMELSRVGRLMNPYEEVPFGDLAREAVELVQGRLLNAHADVRIQDNLPAVFGDRRRLVEVLQNLVDNAAKFLGDQSQPMVEIGQAGEQDDKPVFFVRDNGIGIKREHQERIFGLFNKLSSETDGTGIGLSLVKRIVEVHQGRIWVESTEGRGSTFYFTLQTRPEPES